MINYKLVGKVGIAAVVGDLPRVGDIVVVPDNYGNPARFKVVQVQYPLVLTTSAGHYNGEPPEVHIELVD